VPLSELNNYQARLNGMTANSYMVEENGRYFALARGLEPRVLREITRDEFVGRSRYEKAATGLMVVGNTLTMGLVIAFLVFRFRRATR